MTKTTPTPQPKINIDINPESTPILYTDNILIRSNNMGVTLDVCQLVGPKRLKVTSRIGMSREHAKKFVAELGRTLAMTEKNEKN